MITAFAGESADEVWLSAAQAFRDGTGVSSQDSRAGATNEILHAAISISDPRQRWVVNRRPSLNPAFAIAETVWIINGRDDSAFLNYWHPGLPKYAGEGPTYTGAYGYRLRNRFGHDQLGRAWQALRNNPASRQVVLQIWDPRLDLPAADGTPAHPDVPCNVSSLLKVRDGRLEWLQVMRSNDLFLGLPHNIVQFTTLQEVVAGWLGLEPGSYNHVSDSLHLYERDKGALDSTDVQSVEVNPDSLALPYEASKPAWQQMSRALDAMRDGRLEPASLIDLVATASVTPAYRNLLAVVGADTARRRGWHQEIAELKDLCTNKALVQALEGWLRRQGVH